MFFLSFRFLRRHVCSRRRSHAAPEGYAFLRNYKLQHRDRIEEAIREAGLVTFAFISDEAYDAAGRRLPGKVALYVNREDAAGLFFQFYEFVKAARHRAAAAPRGPLVQGVKP